MMKIFFDFVIEHWSVIIPCSLGALEFVFLMIFKKRPKVLANGLAEKIVAQCDLAENKFGHGHGQDKLDFVLTYFKNELGDNYKFFEKYIITFIDTILDCQSK